jgi:hypothetical protein
MFHMKAKNQWSAGWLPEGGGADDCAGAAGFATPHAGTGAVELEPVRVGDQSCGVFDSAAAEFSVLSGIIGAGGGGAASSPSTSLNTGAAGLSWET